MTEIITLEITNSDSKSFTARPNSNTNARKNRTILNAVMTTITVLE